MVDGPHINDPGYEVPDGKILVVPHSPEGNDGYWEEIILPLKGQTKRDWFTSHFYYCLPLTIGNQYGFAIKSLRDFNLRWLGGNQAVKITFLNEDNDNKQFITNDFYNGVVTVQNAFALKTPPGINLMTVQPPNSFIRGCAAMTGVIETDNIRRDFTFNFKVTVQNINIEVRKGDLLGAFIPIPRNFVENFSVDSSKNHFDMELIKRESEESDRLSLERQTVDKERPHQVGRRYFKGEHSSGIKYVDHQKTIQ